MADTQAATPLEPSVRAFLDALAEAVARQVLREIHETKDATTPAAGERSRGSWQEREIGKRLPVEE